MSSIMREDWIEVEIGTVANIYNGNSINAQVKEERYKNLKDGYNYIGTKDVGFDAVVDYDNGVKIPFEEETFKIAPKGCVLVCSEGGSAGRKTAYIEQDVCFGNKLYAIADEYNVLEGKYVFYYSRFRKFFDDFKNQMNGIIGGVSTNKFAEISFPLAPLPIQRAIVSKTEELFSDLDNGIASFKKAQEQLKIYRQAVLKKAFEGELTNSSHKDWEYLTLKECVKFSQGIQVDVNLQNENKFKNSVRFLRIIDFTQGNDPARYIDNPCEKYIVSKDDVSLVRYGASTGFVCSNLEGAIANNLFRVIPTKDIEKKYLFYFLSSPLFQNIISQSVKGAAMPAISFGLINDVLFPFPKDMAEQTQIVQEIESRLSVTDNLEFVIRNSIEKAEALRQSILKKAFEGKLLSHAEIQQCKQAADYEPASELLKKIQAEKAERITNDKLRITKKREKK